MSEESQDQTAEQTEQTPKGLTVPVPKREDFLGNLKKVAEPESIEGARDAPGGKAKP